MSKPSEINVSATMSEGYILESIDLREVSLDGNEFDPRLYIKLQGVNNKNGLTEQIKIYLNPSDSEELARGLNEVIKKGLFKK